MISMITLKLIKDKRTTIYRSGGQGVAGSNPVVPTN